MIVNSKHKCQLPFADGVLEALGLATRTSLPRFDARSLVHSPLLHALAERRQSPPCPRSGASPPTQYRRRRSSRQRRMISASGCPVVTDAVTADVARLLLLLTLTSSAAATPTPMMSTCRRQTLRYWRHAAEPLQPAPSPRLTTSTRRSCTWLRSWCPIQPLRPAAAGFPAAAKHRDITFTITGTFTFWYT